METISEAKLQSKLIRRYESEGWYVVKIIQTSRNGWPDLMLLRNGVCRFVEVKRPGGKPRPLQVYRMKEIIALGFDCQVVDSL
jgi:hypothetical protein